MFKNAIGSNTQVSVPVSLPVKAKTMDPVELILVKKKRDIKESARVLSEAFKDDKHMLWYFGSPKNYQKHSQAVFESWVRYGVMNALVYRTPGFECVAMLKKPGHFGFSVWGMIWSGMIFTSLWYLGFLGCAKLSEYEKASMNNAKQLSTTKNFWYIWQIGTQSASQGQGIGTRVVDCIESKIFNKDEKSVIFVEAISKGSERLFSRKGYNIKGSYKLRSLEKVGGDPVVCMEKNKRSLV